MPEYSNRETRAANIPYGVMVILGVVTIAACLCGYGKISVKLVKKGDRECFSDRFKRHIPVIFPLGIIPVIYGGIGLWRNFTWGLAAPASAFDVESLIILPLVSRRHGCFECPQKEQCPCMAS